jgi:hypothetical protein
MSAANGRTRNTLESRLRQLEADVVRESLDFAADDPVQTWADDERGWVPVGGKTTAGLNPLYWTARHFADVRNDSRHLSLHNGFAIGGLRTRINYIVGTGFKYGLEAMPGIDPKANVVLRTRDFVDAVVELNNFPGLEAESLHRGDRDGEFLIRAFAAGGIPEFRFFEPESMATPDGMADYPHVRCGVQCAVRPNGQPDYASVERYWIDGESVPEAEVVHVKFNTDSSCARGIPLYYPVDASLRRCEDLLRAMSTTSKVRAKIAVLWQLKQINRQVEDDLTARLTQKTQVDASGQRVPVTVEELPFGSVIRYREGEKLELPNANVGSADTVAVLQAELRKVAGSINMTEWMFSALADQKYSNAFVMEALPLRSFQLVQKKLTDAFGAGRMRSRASLVWRAVRMAVAAGVLPQESLTACRVTVTPPTLEVRDKQQEATVNKTYVDMGAKSVATVQKEIGLDPEAEKKLGAKPAAAPPGPPGSAPPGGGQPPDQPGGLPGAGPPVTESEKRLGEPLPVPGWAADLADRLGRVEGVVREARDLSGLVKKKVTDKNGVSRTVYVRAGDRTKGGAGGLPADPKKLKVAEASKALSAKGYTLGRGEFDLDTKKTVYRVTGPDGTAEKMTAGRVKALAYAEDRPAKTVTAARPGKATLSGGKEVTFVPHPNQRADETTVMVDTGKADAAFAGDAGFYIPPGGGGAEIPGRRAAVEAFLATGRPVQAPRAAVGTGGEISFTDGRHRFSVLRDRGAAEVAVTVPKAQEREFASRFGSPAAPRAANP